MIVESRIAVKAVSLIYQSPAAQRSGAFSYPPRPGWGSAYVVHIAFPFVRHTPNCHYHEELYLPGYA
jgi:hypothetical protein